MALVHATTTGSALYELLVPEREGRRRVVIQNNTGAAILGHVLPGSGDVVAPTGNGIVLAQVNNAQSNETMVTFVGPSSFWIKRVGAVDVSMVAIEE